MSQPIETLSYPAGNGSQIQLSVWENEVKKENQTFVTHAVTIQRRYKDGDEWKSSSSFRPSDLLTIAHAMHEAYRLITNERNKK